MRNNYWIFTVFAFVAVLVASISTYDIAYHFSPEGVRLFGVEVSRSAMANLSLVTFDGLYILLDLKLASFRTKGARNMALVFMLLLWASMVSVNFASAVINNTLDTSALGKFSVVVYAVKAAALLYLAFYTYIRYDDPETKRTMIEMESRQARETGINHYINLYSKEFAVAGAKIIAMDKMAELIQAETGRPIQDILGNEWRAKLASIAGVSLESAGKPSKPAPAPIVPPPAAAGIAGKIKEAGEYLQANVFPNFR